MERFYNKFEIFSRALTAQGLTKLYSRQVSAFTDQQFRPAVIPIDKYQPAQRSIEILRPMNMPLKVVTV